MGENEDVIYYSKAYYQMVGFLASALRKNGYTDLKDWESAFKIKAVRKLTKKLEIREKYLMSWSQCDWAVSLAKNPDMIQKLLDEKYYRERGIE